MDQLLEVVGCQSIRVFQWPWVTLNGGTQRVKFFWQISLIRPNFRTVWPRVNKFGMITQVGEKHVSKGSAMPTTLGNVELSIPKIFGTSYMHVLSMRNSNHILMVMKLDVKIFSGSTVRPLPWTIFFWWCKCWCAMLTCLLLVCTICLFKLLVNLLFPVTWSVINFLSPAVQQCFTSLKTV